MAVIAFSNLGQPREEINMGLEERKKGKKCVCSSGAQMLPGKKGDNGF